MAITTRAGKGTPLTNNELDTNFTDLANGVAGRSRMSGFPTDSSGNFYVSVTYDNATRTVTITPTSGTFDFYVDGVKYTKTGVQTKQHTATYGAHFIYYDNTGTLVVSNTFWDLTQTAPVCYVFWDSTNSRGVPFIETHHAGRDVYAHQRLHLVDGTQVVSGFGISGYTLNTQTDVAVTPAISSGVIADEDLQTTTTALADNGPYTKMYRIGSSGEWQVIPTGGFCYPYNVNVPQYNQYTGTTWQLTNVPTGNYFNVWVFAAPSFDTTYQLIFIPGQATYSAVASATAESVSGIAWGSLPFQEIAPLYQLTYRYQSNASGTTKSQLVNVSRVVGSRASISQAAQADHGALAGLLDLDHPASAIINTPSGNLTATDVQSALNELQSDIDGRSPIFSNSAGLAALLSDETGTGNFVLSSAPTLSDVIVSSNSATNALRITQTGSGNALLVEDSASTDSTPFVIDASGKTVVGHTGNYGGYLLQVHTTDGANINATRFSADSGFANIRFDKSRSATIGGIATVNNGDGLGQFTFRGDDGTTFIPAASISTYVDGTPGTNDMPGRLVFSTTADGASSTTERMRIDSAGNIGFGVTPPAGYGMYSERNVTGATTTMGFRMGGTVQSDVTGGHNAFYTRPYTAATAFTLGYLIHYRATQGGLGAGSSITTQYGFYVETDLIGATTNYGYYSGIPAGSGRWNLYMTGTADNYLAGSLAIGNNSLSGFKVRIGGNTPTASGSNAYGIYIDSAIQSDVTNYWYGIRTNPTTAAAAFTLASLIHFIAGNSTIGAGSTVNYQYGFHASSALTGAAVNYGFYSDIAAATNRYNFYANGTAINYFRGSVGIGGDPATGELLRIATNPTGSINTIGLYLNGICASDVTSTHSVVRTYAGTVAAAFTLGTLRHFFATSAGSGAGSTINYQYGFYADSSLTNAGTYNYGFYSGIASGTGRYNFYAGGTADNYFSGAVGIGSLPQAGTYKVLVAGALTASTSVAAYIGGTANSTVTAMYGIRSNLYTEAAAFTLSSITHYFADGASVGAGSTITNQYGFSTSSALTGATNNYGFYSSIASGTGRWNFYAAGTADNYFAGPVQHALGSVSAPSLTFAGDTNTGIYSSGADTLDVAIAGSSAVKINTTAVDAVLRQVRSSRDSVQYVILQDIDAAGAYLTSYSATNNGKPLYIKSTTNATDDAVTAGALGIYFYIRSTQEGIFDGTGFGIPSSRTYKINGTTVLSATALGSGITSSSLTSFGASPTLVTPNIGAATATSVNGTTIPTSKTLVVTTDTLAVHAATTSAQLAGVISDETGSGSLVFATSPTLVTPNIGVATGTSFNSITALASVVSPMNGVAAVGTSTTVARQDHVHATDTSRAPTASPSFTGTASFSGQISSTLATGTAPLSVASTTVVGNLNADMVDGIHSTAIVYGVTGAGVSRATDVQNVYELPQYKAGFWEANGAAWTPDTGWWWGATFAHSSNNGTYNYSGQLAFQNGGGGNNVWARTISNGTPSSWTRLVSTTGGTFTGPLILSYSGSPYIKLESLNSGNPYLAFYQSGNEVAYIQHLAASNTMILQSDAIIGLHTNGDYRVYVNAAGNVGVGTTSPYSKLHVFSNATGQVETVRIQGYYGAMGDGPIIRFTNKHASGLNPNTGEYNLAGIRAFDYDNNWGGGIQLLTSPGVTSGGADLVARLTISSSGNVGIGTDAPTNKLQINGGSVAIIGDYGHSYYGYGANSDNYYTCGSSGKHIFRTGNATEVAWITSTGLGVGTSSPSYALHVVSSKSDDPYLQGYFSTSYNYGGIGVNGVLQSHVRFLINGAQKWQWEAGAAAGTDAITLYGWTAANHVLYINSSGNLHVGPSSTSYKFQVTGDALITAKTYIGTVNGNGNLFSVTGSSMNQVNIASSDGGWGLLLSSNTSGTGVSNYHGPSWAAVVNVQNAPLAFGTNNTARMYITGGGNVGIGTNSPNEALCVYSGNVRIAPANTTGILAFGNSAEAAGYYDTGIYRGAAGSTSAGNILNLGGYGGIALCSSPAAFGSQAIRMYITNTGNIGVGVIPESGDKFEVAGTLRVHTGNNWDGIRIYSGGADGYIQGKGDETGLHIRTEYGNLYLADDRGNISIGTTDAPGNKVYIRDGGHTRVEIASYGAGLTSGIYMRSNNNTDGTTLRDNNKQFEIYIGGYGLAQTINTSGNTIFAGTVSTSSNMYAANFYDYNDNNYYLNPAGTSNLNEVNLVKSWSQGGAGAHYTPFTGFGWDGAAHYYWCKIATITGSTSYIDIEIIAKTDLNYPSCTVARALFARYADASFSMKLDYITSTDVPIYICMDNSGNCWVKAIVAWSYRLAYRVNQTYSTATFYDTPATQEAQPTNSCVVEAGQSVRGTWGSAQTATPGYTVSTFGTIDHAYGIHAKNSNNWSGNPGADRGKLQYHSQRWYIVSGSNSDRIVQFRQDGTDRSWIANDGSFVCSNNVSVTGAYIRASAGRGYLSGEYPGVESGSTTGPIYSIGGSYYPNSNSLNTMYGVGYANTGTGSPLNGAGGAPNDKWGLYVTAGGNKPIFLNATDGDIHATGTLYGAAFSAVQSDGNQVALRNASYGKHLMLGGWTTDTTHCRIRASNGNLHIDNEAGYTTYINWYTNSGVYCGGLVGATKFEDRMNNAYYLVPSGNSVLNGITCGAIDVGSGSVLRNAGSSGNSIVARFKQSSTAVGASTMVTFSCENGAWAKGGLAWVRGAGGYDTGYFSFCLNTAISTADVTLSDEVVRVQSDGLFLKGGKSLHSNDNSAFLRGNDTLYYAPWYMGGSKNGYNGIAFSSGATLMMNNDISGVYRDSVGWHFYWQNGVFYISKSTSNGGGSIATVIDSSTIGSQTVNASTWATYGRYVYNNAAYYGSAGYVEPSGLGVAYANAAGLVTVNSTTNNAAYNVNFHSGNTIYTPGNNNLTFNPSTGTLSTYMLWISNNTSATDQITINAGSGGNGANIRFKTGGSNRATIRAMDDGYIDFLDSAYGGPNFRVGPTGACTYKTSMTLASDRRLKNSIKYLGETVESSLDRILGLNAVTFERNDSPGVVQTGFIAQEVQEFLPDAIVEFDVQPLDSPKETYLSISTDVIVAHLVEAVKELTAKVKSLELQLALRT